MMNEKVRELLNQQINKEFYSAYLYLGFSNYFRARGLDGFANWYMIQAQEERDHAMLFLKYLQMCGEKVELGAIDKPDKKFNGLMDPLKAGLEHEKYVTSLINDIYGAAYDVKDFRTMQFLDWFVKEQLEEELKTKGIDELYLELRSVDPVAAERIHPNNKVRVLRALEVYRATGKTITEQAELSHLVESDIEPLYIGVTYDDREKLYDRINKRVDIMVQNGLVDEAKNVFSKDVSKTAFNSIGCKEIKPYLDGESTLDDCIEKLKLSTRRYAKRQLTWFRRNEKINWVYPDILNEKLYNDIDTLVNLYLAGDDIGEKTQK